MPVWWEAGRGEKKHPCMRVTQLIKYFSILPCCNVFGLQHLFRCFHSLQLLRFRLIYHFFLRGNKFPCYRGSFQVYCLIGPSSVQIFVLESCHLSELFPTSSETRVVFYFDVVSWWFLCCWSCTKEFRPVFELDLWEGFSQVFCFVSSLAAFRE